MHPPPPLPALASQSRRPKLAPLFFLPSVFLTGMAWLSGGKNPQMTDMGFAWMTLCCIAFVFSEIRHFKDRQGWGALIMYGGALLWFCHDYMTHWFAGGPWAHDYPEAMPTIAKMAFLHCLFITLMATGMALSVPDRVTRWIQKYPEPASLEFLFWIALIGLGCNLSYFTLFSLWDFKTTLWASYFGGRYGQAEFSAAFAGNLNTSASAYFALLGEAINIGGTAGAAYAVLSKNSTRTQRLIALLVWAHAMMLAYGSGTRGNVLSQGAPMVAFLIIRAFHEPAFKKAAFTIVVGLGVVFFGMVQIQTFYRMGMREADLTDARLTTQIQGNTMFSEALDAYMDIPQNHPFFSCDSDAEGALRAYPEMLYWFAIGPIPRPLWANKPIDPAWAYRARSMDSSGEQNNYGTTVSYGLVGAWYFRFGLLGMAEGALLMGWLYAAAERMIRTVSSGRLQTMRLILSLSILATLLLFYRDIVFFGVWRLIVFYALIAFAVAFLLPKRTA